MKNLIYLLFLGLLAFAVTGWFLDSYSIAGVPTSSGHHRVQIDVNTDKVKDDLHKGQAKLQDTINRLQGDQAEGSTPADEKQAKSDPTHVSLPPFPFQQ